MKTLLLTIIFLTAAFAISAQTPDYKISKIKVTPFDEQTGQFEDELSVTEPRSFFNDIGTGLFVIVEVSGQQGTFEAGRKLEVTVTEGKKIKAKKLEQIGIVGSLGKYFYPIYLPSSMCSPVTITARILGQKTVTKAVTRKIEFQCGE